MDHKDPDQEKDQDLMVYHMDLMDQDQKKGKVIGQDLMVDHMDHKDLSQEKDQDLMVYHMDPDQ